jgi:hypothetical protein
MNILAWYQDVIPSLIVLQALLHDDMARRPQVGILRSGSSALPSKQRKTQGKAGSDRCGAQGEIDQAVDEDYR